MYKSLFQKYVELAEARAMEAGIEVAKYARLTPLIIESDSSKVVKGIEGSLAEIYWVVTNIQRIIKQKKLFKVSKIARICNIAAYNIAKLALSQQEPVV